MNLKTLIAAAAIVMAPIAASAMTISGELGLSGNTVIGALPDFSPTGSIDIVQDGGPGVGDDAIVIRATGDFASVLTAFTSFVDFIPTIVFGTEPQEIFTGAGGLKFTITDFTAFDNDGTDGDYGFASFGFFELDGFEATNGVLTFSTDGTTTETTFSVNAQVPLPAGVLLMGTALAGFGVMRRRKQRA